MICQFEKSLEGGAILVSLQLDGKHTFKMDFFENTILCIDLKNNTIEVKS
jgi:hypothetical protein